MKVSTDPVQASPGSSSEAIVKLAITSGYHVNANPATYSYLIATELSYVSDSLGPYILIGNPKYPSGLHERFAFAEEPLSVYAGDIEIKLPLTVEANAAKESRTLPIAVRIQACDTEKCFPPATLNAAIPVEVK